MTRHAPAALCARVLEARVEFLPQLFRTPLVLSSGSITEVTQAIVHVRLEVAGRQATGAGSICLSDLWAWPEPSLNHQQRDAILRRLCLDIANDLPQLCGGEPAHPLELGLHLHQSVCHGPLLAALPPAAQPGLLARALCASPFDAAMHDAAGIALGLSALDLYAGRQPLPQADQFLNEPAGGTAQLIAQMLGLPAAKSLPAWLIVGKNDDLECDLIPWVQQRRYRCFKLKIMGRDAGEDARRSSAVFQAVTRLGAIQPRLSVDSNEANPDAASVLAYLTELRRLDPAAYAALLCLEQPTGRDIRVHAYDWSAVDARKPVLLDEGLTDLDHLPLARDQGWSGLALKTCKGHSFVLLAAAWALQQGLLLSLQDLTNAGRCAVHAAVLAGRLPTINGVELNSPQFTPDANAPFLPRLAGILDPRDGCHHLPAGPVIGLGSTL